MDYVSYVGTVTDPAVFYPVGDSNYGWYADKTGNMLNDDKYTVDSIMTINVPKNTTDSMNMPKNTTDSIKMPKNYSECVEMRYQWRRYTFATVMSSQLSTKMNTMVIVQQLGPSVSMVSAPVSRVDLQPAYWRWVD